MKITEFQGKILRITGLVTIAALNTVKNKTPNIIDLVKKTFYNLDVSDIKSKFFTTTGYSIFTNEIINYKIKEKNWLMNLIRTVQDKTFHILFKLFLY